MWRSNILAPNSIYIIQSQHDFQLSKCSHIIPLVYCRKINFLRRRIHILIKSNYEYSEPCTFLPLRVKSLLEAIILKMICLFQTKSLLKQQQSYITVKSRQIEVISILFMFGFITVIRVMTWKYWAFHKKNNNNKSIIDIRADRIST